MEIEKAQVRAPATMPEKFRWLKAILRDENLSASAKNVATALMTFHNDRTGQLNPSQKRLAEAVSLSRMRVNRLVAELKTGGWIEAEGTLGASNYRLVLDRAATTIEAVGVEAPPVSDLKHPCVGSEAGGVSDLKYPYVNSDTQNHTGNRPEEPQRGTTQLNPEPAVIGIKAVEVGVQPEAVGPAKVPEIPVQPATTTSRPVNDDTPEEVGEAFPGMVIPAETIRQWLVAYPSVNVRGEVQKLSQWAAGLPDQPKGRGIKAIQTKLSKLDAENRQTALARKENRQADADAGVKRDCYGRIIPKPKVGWIENPRAAPPGVNPRFWLPPNPGQEFVFRGKGWKLTKESLDKMKALWPGADLRAEISAFDRDHASIERTDAENKTALAGILDGRTAEVKAA